MLNIQSFCLQIGSAPFDILSNGKRVLSVNLKTKEGVEVVKKVCLTSDVLLDTFRPGVMEKMRLGPEVLLKENSRLIYARLTGYGQNSFCKGMAGHDINYVAMSGILSLLRKDNHPPMPPINLLADFVGGSLICALGIVLALFERNKSGNGQVIDNSMTEGVSYIATWLFKSRNLPIWTGKPGNNILDGGCAFYNTYETKDGKFMAVGALEPQFYSNFIKGLNLEESKYPQTGDTEESKRKFEEVFLTKSQEEWCKVFDSIDACVTPVLEFDNIDKYKYHSSGTSYFRNDENVIVPTPAPKLSRTPGVSVNNNSLPKPGQHTIEILKELGYNKTEITNLITNGHVYAYKKSSL